VVEDIADHAFVRVRWRRWQDQRAIVLVLHPDAMTAHTLVRAIDAADGDVVYAATAQEAQQRLRRFVCDLAVVDAATCIDAVATELRTQAVPFCLLGAGTVAGAEFRADNIEAVVPWLVAALRR
jgi:hypothetical protein